MRTKKLWSRVISILLVIALLPVSALAEHTADPKVVTQPDFTVTVSHVNPEYERLGVKFTKPSADCMTMAETTVDSLDEAADYLREQMEDRVTEVTIIVQNHTYVSNQGLSDDWRTILYGAFEHTGVSTQGDYIIRHYGQANGQIGHNGISTATFKYTITYDTTLEQENEVGDKIDELFTAWDEVYNFYDLSDYEQIEMIYDYICANVVYDYDNLNDNSYTLKYSAYAALIQGTAVCQGYANLFYRMALEAGVDNRIIVGDAGGAHAWNIVDMGEKYYYLDSTWDAPRFDYGYKYFLLGSDNFHVDHTPDAEFWNEEFLAEYPIDTKDYNQDMELIMDALLVRLLVYIDSINMDSSLTRLDMAKLIAAMVKLELDGDAVLPYEDCAALNDQEKQIIAAVEKFGVMTAYKDGTFRPAETIDRARLALLLYRTMNGNVDAEDIGDYADDGYFTDVGSYLWYAPYVNYLASIGVIPAWADKTFDPDDTADLRTALRWMVKAANYEKPGDPTEILASGYCGAEYDGSNLTWQLTGDGTLTISGKRAMEDFEWSGAPWAEYSSQITSVVIEEGVTRVGSNAFFSCRNIERVTFPASLTTIRSWSFAYCDSLKEITLPAGLTDIGLYAFSYCDALKSITVDSSNEYFCSEDGVLFSKNKDTLITYPAGKMQAEYTIPDSVAVINKLAFEGSTNLKRIVIPDSVTRIDEGAFADCVLETVYYTGTETQWNKINIGEGNDTLLAAEIVCEGVEPEKPEIPDGVIASGECGDYVIWYLAGDGTLTIAGTGEMEDNYLRDDMPWYDLRAEIVSVVVEDGVTNIGGYVFSGCTNLVSVTIADSVINIGSYAFESCTALEAIELPGRLNAVSNSLFRNCSNLKTITIPGSIKKIEGWAFYGCAALETVYFTGGPLKWRLLEETCVSLGDELREAEVICTGVDIMDGICGKNLIWELDDEGVLTISGTGEMDKFDYEDEPWHIYKTIITSVIVEDGVTNIRESLFYNCDSLKTVTIADSVTEIGDYAFTGCGALESVKLSNGLTAISNSLFSDCYRIKSIIIPANVVSIGNDAFYNCFGLENITIPANVVSIGALAFSLCEALESVTFLGSVKSIGSNAFSNCDALVNVELPAGLTEIASSLFDSCDLLESVTIPESVVTIDSSAFSYCPKLVDVAIPAGVTYIGERVFKECTSLTSVTIPAGVIAIGDSAFSGCASLTSLVIPDGVTYIGKYAFNGCASLTNITLPDSVTTLGSKAFWECSALTSIVIPENVDKIEYFTFYNCTSLESVTISAKVTDIVEGAFSKCSKLATVYYTGTEEQWNAVAIEEDNDPLLNAEVIYEWNNDDGEHTHVYDESVWKNDETNHWHECTCGEKSGLAAHELEEVARWQDCKEPGGVIWHCTVCGYEYTEELPQLEHTPVTVSGYPATCTEPGMTDGVECEVCGTVIEWPEEIPAKGHTDENGDGVCDECGDGEHTHVYDESVWKNDEENHWHECTCGEKSGLAAHELEEVARWQNCMEPGGVIWHCTVCGYEYMEELPQLEHTPVTISGYPATCTEPGMTDGVECEVCGTVIEWPEEIPALGHEYDEGVVTTEPTCTENGVLTYTCQREGCGHSYTEVVKAKGHTDEDNDYICDDCDEELCTEHTEEVVPGKAATCTEPGLTEGKKCATCGKVLEEQEEIPALGHDYDDGVVTTEPTCTEDGVKTYTCEREGCDHSYTEVVKAKGHTDEDNDYICDDCDEELCTEHTEEVIPGKAATCTEPGLTEGKKCATCGKVLKEQEEIPALGHDYDDGVVTTEPTLTEAGIKTYTCEREGCGHSYTEEIAVLEFIEGTCGENVTWKLTKDGVLTISGEGAMYSFTFTADLVPASVLPMGGEKSEVAPWNEYNGLIVKVIIEDGVTGIGDNAFAACENLKEIEIPETVTSIGDGAFTGCEALETVTYTGSEEQWAEIEIGAGNEVMEDIEITIADIIPGDVNGDGSVNIFDAIELLDLIADGSADVLSSGEFRAADVNGDSSVNIFDAIELLDLIASGAV